MTQDFADLAFFDNFDFFSDIRRVYYVQYVVIMNSPILYRETGNDSVEGILFSQDTGVIMTGKFVEEREVEQDKINRYAMPSLGTLKTFKNSIFFKCSLIE